jgi:hypothetical protein
MRAFVCIVIGIITSLFVLFIINVQYTVSRDGQAADMYVEMVEKDANGPDQMAVIAYSQNFCGIELPRAMELALTRYQRQFPAKFEEATSKLYKASIAAGEYKERLHAERCRVSREMVSSIRKMGFS